MLIGKELHCAKCDNLLCYRDGLSLIFPQGTNLNRTNLGLNDGSYCTATTCPNCFIGPDDFDHVTEFLVGEWIKDLDNVDWTKRRKDEYSQKMSHLRVTDIRL
jgi:hypothetical protein